MDARKLYISSIYGQPDVPLLDGIVDEGSLEPVGGDALKPSEVEHGGVVARSLRCSNIQLHLEGLVGRNVRGQHKVDRVSSAHELEQVGEDKEKQHQDFHE